MIRRIRRGYVHHLLLAIDQLLNALLGGYADETLSSRAWRQRHKPRWKYASKVIDTIFFWQEAHCRESYNSEQDRRHLPPEFRDKY